MLSLLWSDTRHGARSLFRNWKFTLGAILSLGLGIGLNTAVFSFVNAVLLRPFPYRDAQQLAIIWGTKSFDVRAGLNGDQIDYWRAHNHSFDDMTVFQINLLPFGIGVDQTDVVEGAMVGANVYSVLGVTPMLGRTFSEERNYLENDKSVVLSYGLWYTRFGQDANIVGRSLDLNGQPYTVIGVMPREFFFPDQTAQLWIPLTHDTGMFGNVQGLARLRVGVTVNQAETELASLSAGSQPTSNRSVRALTPGIFPLYHVIVGRFEFALEVLLAAVSLLLLIGCANVSNLLLARGVSRKREIAVRWALGASRWRILQLLLVENVLLSIGAGAFGVGCALLGVLFLRDFKLNDIPRFASAEVDSHVLLFGVTVAFLTGVLSGVVPGWRATRGTTPGSLQLGGTNTHQRAEGHVLNLLVVIEVALALILLIGAGLLINSFVRLTHSNWGFNAENLLVVDAPLAKSQAQTKGMRVEYGQQVLQRLSNTSGVVSSAMAYGLPLSYGYKTNRFSVDGQTYTWDAPSWNVSSNYFRTMDVPVLRGHEFDKGDDGQMTRSLIVSEAFAQRVWGKRNPLGLFVQFLRLKKELREQARKNARLALPETVMQSPASWEPDGAPFQIIGEVGNVRSFGLDTASEPDVYVNYVQAPELVGTEKFIVRTSQSPRKMLETIKKEIATANVNATIGQAALMSDLVNRSIGGRGSNKLLLIISGMFGGISLLLGATGIYSVVSFAVTQRIREIGIRRALGARTRHIVVMVAQQVLRPVVLGLLLGLVGSVLATRFLSGFLFGVSANDPVTLCTVTALLLIVAMSACAGPAARALKVSTVTVLRHE